MLDEAAIELKKIVEQGMKGPEHLAAKFEKLLYALEIDTEAFVAEHLMSDAKRARLLTLTHLFTHSLTHLYTHPPTHSLIHLPTHSLTRSLAKGCSKKLAKLVENTTKKITTTHPKTIVRRRRR